MRSNSASAWIAAVALANGLPVFTQDSGFDVLAELGALGHPRVAGTVPRGKRGDSMVSGSGDRSGAVNLRGAVQRGIARLGSGLGQPAASEA